MAVVQEELNQDLAVAKLKGAKATRKSEIQEEKIERLEARIKKQVRQIQNH